MRQIIACFVLLITASLPATAGVLDQFTDAQAVKGLKDALTQGAGNAVDVLGKENGFLGNAQVKIPLPPALKKAEKLLRTFGMGKQADELVTSMNRAAEAAVPEAKQLLVDSVKQMSVQDAKSILTGGDGAATAYFRRTTESKLRTRFMPIVSQATEKVGLAQKYNEFGGQAAQLGLIDKKDAKVEDYVAQKALDGLYLMMAQEEKKIRSDPVGAATDIARRIFGAIQK